MSSPQLELALWVSQPLIQFVIAIVAYRRKLYKEFPAFFLYTVVWVAMFCVELPVYLWTNDALYNNVFWTVAAIDVVLSFKVIHEIFADIFHPYPALKDLGTALFKWAALIMVLVSLVMISVAPGWDEPVRRTILVVQRGVRVVQCGLVIFLLAFCKSLGVSWRRRSFGIALGFGLFSSVELLSTALYSGSHLRAMLMNMITMGAYDAGMLLWLWYSLMRRQDATVPVLVPQRWDEALADIHPQGEGESLIPMFEHMVEQALSKTQTSHL